MNTEKDKPEVFTEDQLSDWDDYESIRQSGAYNMLDPRARLATGLSGDEYRFVMHNYSALKAAVEAAKAK